MNRLRGYVRLMRPVNCAMMGFAVIVGIALTSLDAFQSAWQNLVYGLITGFTLTAASMAINDYFDQGIDAVNEPNRPIPSGLIKPRDALRLAFVLTCVGFATAFFTNLICFAISIIAWAIFVTYTTVGKRSGLPGNFLVGVCVAIPLIYGSAAAASAVAPNVLIFVFMILLSITGREVNKGIVDVQGDRTRNVKTIAVRYSEKAASVVVAAFYVLAVLLTPIPWFLGLVSVWFIPLVAVTDLGLMGSSLSLLRDCSRQNAKRIKNMVLLWFVFALLAFLAGGVKV